MDPGHRVLYLPTGRRAVYAGAAPNGELILFFVSLVPPPVLSALTQGKKASFVAWAAANLHDAVHVSPAAVRVVGRIRQPLPAAAAT